MIAKEVFQISWMDLNQVRRKIMFGAFKRNLVKEVKVAQLSGYISEHAAYHHGETSLQKAITGMAQEFMGSNNIALLMPNGQFGTRLEGGKDSASPRYIFTQLNKITKIIFNEYDKCILNYLEDDGSKIEPDFLCSYYSNDSSEWCRRHWNRIQF